MLLKFIRHLESSIKLERKSYYDGNILAMVEERADGKLVYRLTYMGDRVRKVEEWDNGNKTSSYVGIVLDDWMHFLGILTDGTTREVAPSPEICVYWYIFVMERL